MKEAWVKYKEWWGNLATRERQAVTLGGSLLVMFIFYQWIWIPYIESVASLRRQIQTGQTLVEWMQTTDKAIRQLENQVTGGQKRVSPVVFLGVMQKQINQAGLHDNLTQLKQATNDAIEMHFQKVEFDKLISLLISVVKKQKASITQMSVTADSIPGLVMADTTLKLI